MSTRIPIYELSVFAENPGEVLGIFFSSERMGAPRVPIEIPYRSNYYKVGLCLEGKGMLHTNMESGEVLPGTLILTSPYIIKQWTHMSADYRSLDVFFTRQFMSSYGGLDPDRFSFFEQDALHVVPLMQLQVEGLEHSLRLMKEKYAGQGAYRDQVLCNLIGGLLYEVATLYEQQVSVVMAAQSRSQLLASDFKKLVNVHFRQERGLKFYADQLFVTSKHLSETMKEVTGKTAGEWITEAVMLEAKVLLFHPTMSIAQVSEALHFTDQSTFGKFFKNNTGLSPAAYKQSLQ